MKDLSGNFNPNILGFHKNNWHYKTNPNGEHVWTLTLPGENDQSVLKETRDKLNELGLKRGEIDSCQIVFSGNRNHKILQQEYGHEFFSKFIDLRNKNYKAEHRLYRPQTEQLNDPFVYRKVFLRSLVFSYSRVGDDAREAVKFTVSHLDTDSRSELKKILNELNINFTERNSPSSGGLVLQVSEPNSYEALVKVLSSEKREEAERSYDDLCKSMASKQTLRRQRGETPPIF